MSEHWSCAGALSDQIIAEIECHVLKIAGGAWSPLDALVFAAPPRHRDDAKLKQIETMLA